MGKIVIIGGGVMGSSIAYHLARAGAAADVTVVEPDPTYAYAATPRAVGGVRLQQGLRQNLQMSLYGLEVYTHFSDYIKGAPVDYDPAFRRQGYMYLVSGAAGLKSIEATSKMQQGLGVDVSILDRSELRRRFPSFDFPGIDAGSYSPADGQIDPNAALMGYRRAAEGNGIAFRKDKVVGLSLSGRKVSKAHLESGGFLDADLVINAANCWAPEICAMVGMKVPIEPMRRQQFYFLTSAEIEPIPTMRESSGFAVRPERDGYLVAITKFNEKGGFNWNLEYDLFDEFLWPELVKRSKSFEAVKMQKGWVGHYDMNRLDNNPIIGPFEGEVDNFVTVAGFSGHGLQHAPAVGRGVSEWITGGRYQSIDLSCFSYRRIVEGRPLDDGGPKA